MATTTLRSKVTIIGGMALFYVLFLLSVMKYFEDPEPFVVSAAKITESVPVSKYVEEEQTATVPAVKLPIYVKSRVYPSPTASSSQDVVEFLSLLRREIEDHSQMTATRVAICNHYDDGNYSNNDSVRCKTLFPSGTIRPRLQEPMGGHMVRNALRLARSIVPRSKRSISTRQ